MIYQIFSIILSALFLMFMFLTLWYIAIPLLAVVVLVSALRRLRGRIKNHLHKRRTQRRPIHANDVIDVDFKEVK